MRTAAPALGQSASDLNPKLALVPFAQQLRDFAAMVPTAVPRPATWVQVTVPSNVYSMFERNFEDGGAGASAHHISGWLLEQDDHEIHILDFLGVERWIPKPGISVKSASLRDEIGHESHDFAIPSTLLPGVWAWQRGDVRTAAALLTPIYANLPDPSKLRDRVVDHLARVTHEALIHAVSYERDFPKAIRLGRHLGGPLFNGYEFQNGARELAEELAVERKPPPVTVPTLEQWNAISSTLSIDQKISYLLECLPAIHPPLPRDAALPPGSPEPFDPEGLVWELHPGIAQIPTMVPFLADDRFVPVPVRERGLTSPFKDPTEPRRVSTIVAEMINDIAKQDLVRPDELRGLPAAARRKCEAEIVAWSREHIGTSEVDLYLSALRDPQSSRETRWDAMAGLVTLHDPRVVPFLAQQAKEEPQYLAAIIMDLFKLNSPESVPTIREIMDHATLSPEPLLTSERLYMATILLRFGDRQHFEGLQTIRDILQNTEEGSLFDTAWDDLVSLHQPDIDDLLATVVQKPQFCDWGGNCSDVWICRLLKMRRRDVIDGLKARLPPTFDAQSAINHWSQPGDAVGWILGRWTQGKIPYDERASPQDRAATRVRLAAWLDEQYERIQAGDPNPDLDGACPGLNDASRSPSGQAGGLTVTH
jgi:hypothetical protein